MRLVKRFAPLRIVTSYPRAGAVCLPLTGGFAFETYETVEEAQEAILLYHEKGSDIIYRIEDVWVVQS